LVRSESASAKFNNCTFGEASTLGIILNPVATPKPAAALKVSRFAISSRGYRDRQNLTSLVIFFKDNLEMRADRLLSILMTLQLRAQTTAGELAKQLEVSERTIYRDINALEVAGVPIVADRGRSGGLRLMDGYQTRLTGLSGREAEALPFAEIGVAASALGLVEAAEMARSKVFAALSAIGRERALRASERFYLDPAEWYQRPETPACLKPLAAAVWANQSVEIDYESWRGRKRRVVEPLGLVLKAGVWYMVARNRDRHAIYRVESIHAIRALQESRVQRHNFHLARVWEQEVSRFEASLRHAQATVRVHQAAMARVNRLGAESAEAIRSAKPDAEGRRTATIWIESLQHASGLLLGFDSDIEVLSPEALRRELAIRARRVTALYRRPACELPLVRSG
jgi:predicted DNA-binding transcriptional regulator YafY